MASSSTMAPSVEDQAEAAMEGRWGRPPPASGARRTKFLPRGGCCRRGWSFAISRARNRLPSAPRRSAPHLEIGPSGRHCCRHKPHAGCQLTPYQTARWRQRSCPRKVKLWVPRDGGIGTIRTDRTRRRRRKTLDMITRRARAFRKRRHSGIRRVPSLRQRWNQSAPAPPSDVSLPAPPRGRRARRRQSRPYPRGRRRARHAHSPLRVSLPSPPKSRSDRRHHRRSLPVSPKSPSLPVLPA